MVEYEIQKKIILNSIFAGSGKTNNTICLDTRVSSAKVKVTDPREEYT